jgi:hypothetical protein
MRILELLVAAKNAKTQCNFIVVMYILLLKVARVGNSWKTKPNKVTVFVNVFDDCQLAPIPHKWGKGAKATLN